MLAGADRSVRVNTVVNTWPQTYFGRVVTVFVIVTTECFS
jgi:hypothetical protein